VDMKEQLDSGEQKSEDPVTDADSSVKRTSRRDFLSAGSLAAAAGAGSLSLVTSRVAVGADVPPVLSVRMPKDFTESLEEAPKPGTFSGAGMTGAQVFANLCKEENLAAMFMAPGNYTVTHAIAAAGIPSYGGRTEGGMAAAADGFSRASGEVVACSGTEGPGFTHMIMSIAGAAAARTPLLVLASNVVLAGEDREAFIQNIYQQPLTTGLKKYGKRIILPNRVYEYGAYAFRNLKTGIPGPVHLDFPGEVARQRFTNPSQLTDYFGKDRYRTESRATQSPQDMRSAVAMIEKAERPLIIAGQGVFQHKAWDALRAAAEKNDCPVVTSGPCRGHFPDDHKLSAALSPDACMSADLLIFVGQYSMPSHSDYRTNPDAKTIRVHPEGEDLGRNWPLELGIVSDERTFLEALAEMLSQKKRDAWTGEVAKARAAYETELDDHYALGVKYSVNGAVHPAVIGKELFEFLYHNKAINPQQTLTGWGGFTCQRFVAPRMRAQRPAHCIIAPYQFGSIGPDLAVLLGSAIASKQGAGPQKAFAGAPTFVLTSDAGMAYSLFELATAAKYKIPLVAIVYNNNAWSTFVAGIGEPRSVQLHLFQENIRYDKMAEQIGAHGEYVTKPEQLRPALQRSYDVAVKQSLPSLINVQAIKEFSIASQYPPGPVIAPEPGIIGFMH
jgi:thiamine pyrophosphate-dependent acetolactate synthase large subunit-like protein